MDKGFLKYVTPYFLRYKKKIQSSFNNSDVKKLLKLFINIPFY